MSTDKKQITEEMQIHKEWYEKAGKQTIETLPEFLNSLMNDYQHDYGTICHAVASAAIAGAHAINNHAGGGITGFQAGAVMWEFIRNWNYSGNKTGMRIVDYDNLLYPQYEDKFQNTISQSTWNALQKEAKTLLAEKSYASENVVRHWQSVADGNIPFGFTISND